MDVACPSLPLNVLTDDKLRPVRRHTPRMAADGCHLATCSAYVLLVIIEISSSPYAIMPSRELSCIRQDHQSCQALFCETHLLAFDYSEFVWVAHASMA